MGSSSLFAAAYGILCPGLRYTTPSTLTVYNFPVSAIYACCLFLSGHYQILAACLSLGKPSTHLHALFNILFQLAMPKSQSSRTRAKRRQAVHQTMHHVSVSTPARKVSQVSTTSARSKRSSAQGARQPLLSLIPQLILASMNVNGLSPETEWAISSILEGQYYDVSAVPLLFSYTFFPLSGALFK